ncbi:hypothetical protein AYO38_12105 [bacterium SCGC AG-212-C10]|nr:hypothetical protein AYO38_12105 [bacterium SCGC AG-212-C10]
MATATATKFDAQIMRLENQYRDAMISGDTATLEKITADPCLVVGPQGAMQVGRRQMTDMVKSSDYRLKSYKVDERTATTHEIGDGVIAIAYKVHDEYEDKGKQRTMDSFNTSVWNKHGTGWQCTVHTETPLEPPK